jgi:hypothetical protein
MSKEYDIGDVSVLRASFVDQTKAPIDPGTVKVVVRDPTGIETSHTYSPTEGPVIKDAVGAYHFELSRQQAPGATAGSARVQGRPQRAPCSWSNQPSTSPSLEGGHCGQDGPIVVPRPRPGLRPGAFLRLLAMRERTDGHLTTS